jgi:hypothetical protein
MNFEHDGLRQIISPEINIIVNRIIPEPLTNIALYSESKEAIVKIVFYDFLLQ